MNPLADSFIYVLGPCKLQNQLMGSFVEEKTGAKCKVVERFQDIPPAEHEKDEVKPRLALLDCLGKDYDACLSELESSIEWSSSITFVGLFNINRGFGIEEDALTRGARGFFYQEDSPEKLIKGIHAILDGEIWLSRKIMSQCIRKNTRFNGLRKKQPILSHRETQILLLVASGATNAEIANSLYISAHTVKTHIYKIFKKINVPNRLQAAFWAAKNL